jgi:uncharacterized protein YjbI with pentapeptide repeats
MSWATFWATFSQNNLVTLAHKQRSTTLLHVLADGESFAWKWVMFKNVDFQNVNFQNVDFQNVNFQNFDFQNVNFRNVNCQNVD